MSKKRVILAAAGVGFLIPICWGVAGFALFNLRESVWSKLFWALVYATCPLWRLPGGPGGILTPCLNPLLYGLTAYLILIVKSKLRN